MKRVPFHFLFTAGALPSSLPFIPMVTGPAFLRTFAEVIFFLALLSSGTSLPPSRLTLSFFVVARDHTPLPSSCWCRMDRGAPASLFLIALSLPSVSLFQFLQTGRFSLRRSWLLLFYLSFCSPPFSAQERERVPLSCDWRWFFFFPFSIETSFFFSLIWF